MKLFSKKPDTFNYEEPRTCMNCAQEFKGRFCNRCGEKVIEPYERSILSLLDNLLNAFTFLEGKFIRSFKLLITKPGMLSRNIADGIRVPYMKVVSLFFVANFFYFLFPFFDSFNSSLYTQMNLLGSHSENVKEIVTKEIAERNISFEEFKTLYQSQSTNLSKLLIVLLVLKLSLMHAVVNFSKKNFFSDHLLISFEFYSFHLLVNMLLLPVFVVLLIKLAAIFGWDWSSVLHDRFLSWPVFVAIGYFMLRSQLIFYVHRWYWAIPKALILFYALRYTIDLYRHLLFYFTMWTL